MKTDTHQKVDIRAAEPTRGLGSLSSSSTMNGLRALMLAGALALSGKNEAGASDTNTIRTSPFVGLKASEDKVRPAIAMLLPSSSMAGLIFDPELSTKLTVEMAGNPGADVKVIHLVPKSDAFGGNTNKFQLRSLEVRPDLTVLRAMTLGHHQYDTPQSSKNVGFNDFAVQFYKSKGDVPSAMRPKTVARTTTPGVTPANQPAYIRVGSTIGR